MKNKKILKIILIIVLVVIVIFAIHVIRNYFIISKIVDMQENLSSITNFSYKITPITYEGKTNGVATERYYKDGKNIAIFETNGTKYILWSDATTNESIIINPTELKAVVSSNDVLSSAHIPILLPEGSTSVKLGLSVLSFITYGEVNGEECYVVHWAGVTDYISKENGTYLRTNNVIFSNAEEEFDMLEYSDWTFNELADEDVSRPNLTGYEVTYE